MQPTESNPDVDHKPSTENNGNNVSEEATKFECGTSPDTHPQNPTSSLREDAQHVGCGTTLDITSGCGTIPAADDSSEAFELLIRPVGKPPFEMTVTPTLYLSDLRTMIAERLGGGHVRLLHKGKQLKNGNLAENGLVGTKAKLTVLFSSTAAVTSARELKEDVLLRGLDSRGTPAPKYVGVPTTSARRPTLFGSVRPVLTLPDWRAAEEILNELAHHPGFHAAMARRGWRVGVLVEMYPEGRVGVDPVTVLGLNVNKGAEIHLRLRTDDLQGFRPMHKLYEVLAHELAHNRYSDHGPQFKAEMLAVQREAEEGDWRYSRGRVLGSGVNVENTTPGSLIARQARYGPGAAAAVPHTRAVNVGQSRLLQRLEAEKRKRGEDKDQGGR